jgi:hypothetical protein
MMSYYVSVSIALFKSAVSFLKTQAQKKGDDDDDDIDEEKAVEAHDRAYNQKQGSSLDAKSMGTAAALQAFKQFSQGGGSNEPKPTEDNKSKLIGMAMAQAAKLFDSSGMHFKLQYFIFLFSHMILTFDCFLNQVEHLVAKNKTL